MKHLVAPAILAALVAASPASAQSADEKINMVIAYNESECPVAQPGEVVVCEILVEEDRYRIPSNLRYSDNPANQSLARQVDQIKYVGDFGAMSCSPAGAGGFTGCTQKFIEAAYQDRAEEDGVRFGRLIEEARAERLSTIDEDAAAEQSRVEMIEREYMERLERERAGEVPNEGALPVPPQ
ncbi:MAG: hypothetical protein GW858_11975 [Sphingomonadales bacterium]|nr:hypothetical protein [Sphingomonadales bacterium]NCQ19973.1 hypothetical protein [Sphingomonadales bacterium]NCT02385.1 hypothetical protein [Sphingomonadales bacterium]